MISHSRSVSSPLRKDLTKGTRANCFALSIGVLYSERGAGVGAAKVR